MEEKSTEIIKNFFLGLKTTNQLENNLYEQGLEKTKWLKILLEKSKTIRQNFEINQHLIEEHFKVLMANPKLMDDETLQEMSVIIYNLNAKDGIIDSFLMYDFEKVLYNEQIVRNFSLANKINTLAVILNSGTFLFNIKCDYECHELSKSMFKYSEKFSELSLNTLEERRARKNILNNIFRYIYEIVDIHYLSKTHDFKKVYDEIFFVIKYIKIYKKCDLTPEEKALLDSNIHSILVFTLDMIITFSRSQQINQITPFSDEELEYEKMILSRAYQYYKDYFSNGNDDDIEAKIRYLFICNKLGYINDDIYYESLMEVYNKRPILFSLDNLYETYAYDFYVVCPGLLMDALYSNENISTEHKKEECNTLFLNTIQVLERNKKNLTNEHSVQMITDFIHDTFIYLENKDDFLVDTICDLFFHQQLFTALHQEMVSKISLMIASSVVDDSAYLFENTPIYNESLSFNDNKENILDYIRKAALLHDFGKIKYYDIINLQYRNVTNLEFESIKRHTITGYDLLVSNSDLKMYSAVAGKHHISFDKKSGYPLELVNISNEYDIYVDIVAIADSLDAATDILGRNYAHGKKFDDIFDELIKFKG